MSQMTNTSMANVHMDSSFLSMMKAIPNFTGALEPQCSFSFSEARVRNIAENTVLSRYLLKQLRSSYDRYVMVGRLVKRNSDMMPLLESLNEGRGTVES